MEKKVKFILGIGIDPEKNYVIHMDFPRFILDMDLEEIEWMEDLSLDEEINSEQQEKQLINLCQQAIEFYNHQMESLDEN